MSTILFDLKNEVSGMSLRVETSPIPGVQLIVGPTDEAEGEAWLMNIRHPEQMASFIDYLKIAAGDVWDDWGDYERNL